jgi:Chaperone of endosialidase
VADNTTTPNKALIKPIVGNSEDTWGTYLNSTIDTLDTALGGTLTLAITAGTTLTAAQAANTGYKFTGTLSADANITFPASYHGLAVVRNATSKSLFCGIANGTRVTVPSGQTIAMWSDGTDFVTTTIPLAATTMPAMNGSVSVGTGTTWARSDHIHPTDTSLFSKTGGTITGNLTVNGNTILGSGGVQFTLAGATGHAYAFGWTGSNLVAYVDGTNVGQVAMQAGYLPLSGGTVTGSLQVNGNLMCADGRLICRNSGGYQSCVSAWNVNNNVAVGFWCETNGWMSFGGCDGTGAPVAQWMTLSTAGDLNTVGGINCTILAGNNYIRGNNGVFAASDNSFGFASNSGYRVTQYAGGWYWGWNVQTGELVWVTPGGLFWSQRAADGLCFNNLGRVAGHGPYADLSDVRSKVAVAPTNRGLPEILKIEPIRFRRLFSDGRELEHDEIGFSAQQIEKIIPEAVVSLGITLPDGSGGLDTDKPSLGVTPEVITAVLVNAVKELDQRIRKLEKKDGSGRTQSR